MRGSSKRGDGKMQTERARTTKETKETKEPHLRPCESFAVTKERTPTVIPRPPRRGGPRKRQGTPHTLFLRWTPHPQNDQTRRPRKDGRERKCGGTKRPLENELYGVDDGVVALSVFLYTLSGQGWTGKGRSFGREGATTCLSFL